MLSAPARRARAHLASVSARADRVPAEVITEARRDYVAAALADHIARVVAEAPPLTNEQREKLALLLRGGAFRRGHPRRGRAVLRAHRGRGPP